MSSASVSARNESSRELIASAHHEAGHAVVALDLEVPFMCVTIGPGGWVTLDGGAIDASYASPELRLRQLAAELVVLSAGYWAQRRVDFPARAWWSAGGDWRAMRKRAAMIDPEDEQRQRELVEEARELAEETVERVWHKITVVADALLAERFLTTTQVEGAIKRAMPWLL